MTASTMPAMTSSGNAIPARFMSLEPGDVISTGTPPGVGLGQKPPVYLKGGEVMRLGIDGLGIQTQKVVRT